METNSARGSSLFLPALEGVARATFVPLHLFWMGSSDPWMQRQEVQWLERAGWGPRYIHISLPMPGSVLTSLSGFTKVVFSKTPTCWGWLGPGFILSKVSGCSVVFCLLWMPARHIYYAWWEKGGNAWWEKQDLPESHLEVATPAMACCSQGCCTCFGAMLVRARYRR